MKLFFAGTYVTESRRKKKPPVFLAASLSLRLP